MRVSRVCLGTAQFGSEYGIANQGGKPHLSMVKEILHVAREAGLTTLDTAVAYGDSEMTLGQAGCSGFDIVTKLPPLPSGVGSVRDWVFHNVRRSLSLLRVDQLYGLLLHRPGDLLGPRGPELLRAVTEVQQSGLARKLGYSIYSPLELHSLVPVLLPGIVQGPLNVIDRRLVRTGWLERLSDQRVEVHARSVFLQGLLLMKRSAIPPAFSPWDHLWDAWHQNRVARQVDAVRECLAFSLSQAGVHSVVVGVESPAQLREIISASTELELRGSWDFLECDDEALVNPAKWGAT